MGGKKKHTLSGSVKEVILDNDTVSKANCWLLFFYKNIYQKVTYAYLYISIFQDKYNYMVFIFQNSIT